MFIFVKRGLSALVFERNCGVGKNINGLITNIRQYSVKKERPRLTSEKAKARHFVDFSRIRLIGGTGGDGGLSFMSLYANEFAGADGGNGGNGGHLVFKADSSLTSLSHLNPVYKGGAGEKGQHKHCSGKNAESTFIKVPVGTFFRDDTGSIIADLKEHGDIFLAARGGAGGKGNYFFLNNDNRAPRTFEKGGIGEEKVVHAELRVIAHFGLVGLPNAGKSSLLRCLTRATPKIGCYPFTTLFPHVGVMEFDDYEQVRLADIPGLIEGAHMNRGLGFSFLRHVEQCNTLIYLLDLSYDNVVWQLDMLKSELEHFRPGLSDKPHLIVGNKIDLEMGPRNYDKLVDNLKGSDSVVMPISARKKINIPELIDHIRRMYDTHIVPNDIVKK